MSADTRTDPPTPDPLTPERIALLRRIANAALNTWVGRNWPSMEAMRRDGIGHGLVEKSGRPDQAIRRYLDTFQPDLVVELLDRAAALPSAPDHRLREALADIAVGTTTGMTDHRIERIVRDADYALRALERGDIDNARAALRRGFQRAPVELRAALSEATPNPEATLDVAWREAEAALPEGWTLELGLWSAEPRRPEGMLPYEATAAPYVHDENESGVIGRGSDPTSAVLQLRGALAARLRGPA